MHFYDFKKSKILSIGYKSFDNEKITFVNVLLINLTNIGNKILVLDATKNISKNIINTTVVNSNYDAKMLTFLKNEVNSDKFIFIVGLGINIDMDKKLSEYLKQ